jgi:UDP-N-acetylmuramoylalanine-D-glutamate ligase
MKSLSTYIYKNHDLICEELKDKFTDTKHDEIHHCNSLRTIEGVEFLINTGCRNINNLMCALSGINKKAVLITAPSLIRSKDISEEVIKDCAGKISAVVYLTRFKSIDNIFTSVPSVVCNTILNAVYTAFKMSGRRDVVVYIPCSDNETLITDYMVAIMSL